MLNLSYFDNERLQSLEPIYLSEHLPQVGSMKINYMFDFHRAIFLLEQPTSEPLDYIINNEYELLLGRGHYKLNKKRETLISAGRVIIDKKITYIDNDSGHYNPSNEHLKKVILIFRELNLLSDDFSFFCYREE